MMKNAYWQEETEPGNPWHNMEVDASMLAKIRSGCVSCPAIRIYQWDRPAVSIGRLQPEEPVRRLYPHLPCVRRPTGGRAVKHGEDLTVTIVTRAQWLPGESGSTVLSSYRLLMAGFANALKQAGHDVCFGREKPHGSRGSIHCFDLAAGCDLVDAGNGRKLVGSAQRREGDAILQQISLPLALLPDRKAFFGVLREGFGKELCIDEWLFIDMVSAVCYTNPEESEGSRPWHAKF